MARRRGTAIDRLDPEVYMGLCRDIAECDSIEEEVALAEIGGVEGAGNARQALEELRAAARQRITAYFPGRPVPGQPRPDKRHRR